MRIEAHWWVVVNALSGSEGCRWLPRQPSQGEEQEGGKNHAVAEKLSEMPVETLNYLGERTLDMF